MKVTIKKNGTLSLVAENGMEHLLLDEIGRGRRDCKYLHIEAEWEHDGSPQYTKAVLDISLKDVEKKVEEPQKA